MCSQKGHGSSERTSSASGRGGIESSGLASSSTFRFAGFTLSFFPLVRATVPSSAAAAHQGRILPTWPLNCALDNPWLSLRFQRQKSVSSLCSATFRVCDGRRLGSHLVQRRRRIFHIIRELHPGRALRCEDALPEHRLFSAPTAPAPHGFRRVEMRVEQHGSSARFRRRGGGFTSRSSGGPSQEKRTSSWSPCFRIGWAHCDRKGDPKGSPFSFLEGCQRTRVTTDTL